MFSPLITKRYRSIFWLATAILLLTTSFSNCADVDFSGGEFVGEFSGPSTNNNDLDQNFVVNEDEILNAIVDFEKLNREIGGIDQSTLVITLISQASHGEVSNLVASTGAFTYMPALNYNGSDSFTVSVSGYSNKQKKNFTSSRDINITVLPINDPPEITTPAGILATITTGSTAQIQIAARDIDGDSLSYMVFDNDKGGTFTSQGGGNFTYTPASCSFSGDENFKVRVTDAQGITDVESYSIKVNAASNTINVARTIAEDMPLNDSLIGQFTTCYNTAGAQSIAITTPNPTKGVVSNLIDAGLKYTYTPTANANGSDTLTFNVVVGGVAKTVVVALTITPVNDNPSMTPLTYEVMRNSSITFNPTFSDVDGNPVTLKLNSMNVSQLPTTLGGLITKINETTFKYQAPLGVSNQADTHKVLLYDGIVNYEITLTFNIVSNPIVDLQPAFAVRGLSCTICHAQVNSAIISDFGKTGSQQINSAAYWEHNAWGVKDSDDLSRPVSSANYGAASSLSPIMAFESAKVNGTFYVPNGVTATNVNFPTATAISSILGSYRYKQVGIESMVLQPDDYYNMGLNTPDTSFFGGGLSAPANPTPAAWATIQAKDEIYIGAPTAADITASMGNMATEFEIQGNTSGFAMKQISENGHRYFSNTGVTALCNGDIIVKGDVVLSKLKITTKSGCRIYATGTIFIQDQLTIEQEAGGSLANLQLASSLAVVFGVDFEGIELRRAWISALPENAALATRNDATGNNTFTSILNSAVNLKSVVKDATLHNNRNISFNRILVNAPVVHSRYTGNFTGVIIAEVALMSPGNFIYSFDSIFANANIEILPNLDGRKILRVK